MQAASEELAKQKDFAAKAYGFLVSCYYFICAPTPLPLRTLSGAGSKSEQESEFELELVPESESRTCNFLQHTESWGTVARQRRA